VSRSLGFVLLLLFTVKLISQELNTSQAPKLAPIITSHDSHQMQESAVTALIPQTSSSKAPNGTPTDNPEEVAKMKALKQQAEKEELRKREKAKAAAAASSSASKPSSSASLSRQSSFSSATSSKDKQKPVTSAAIGEAAGSATQTTSADSAMGVPYSVSHGPLCVHKALLMIRLALACTTFILPQWESLIMGLWQYPVRALHIP
jgi:hypothetical protein